MIAPVEAEGLSLRQHLDLERNTGADKSGD